MPRLQLFEYTVLYHPKATKEQVDNRKEPNSTIIVEPARILAPSAKEAGIKASRAIPAEYEDKLEDVEVLVHPF